MRRTVGQGPYRRNIRRYYVFRALSNMLLWMPIWVVYLQHRGLSLTQIGLADAWTLVIMAVAEVPSGGFADRYGRRLCLALGSVLVALGAGLFVLDLGFWMVLVAFVPWMIGATLIESAGEAILYDSLQADGQSDAFTVVNSRAIMVQKGSQALASVVGGVLAGMTALFVPFLGFAVISVVAALVALSLREPPLATSVSEQTETLLTVLKRAATLIRGRPLIRYVVVYRAAINTAPFILVFLLLQPYATSVGVPIAALGVVVLAMRVCGMVGTYLGGLVNEGRAMPLLGWSVAAMIAGLVTLAFVDGVAGLALVGVIALVGALQEPLLATMLHRETTSDVRATVVSVQGLLFTGFLLVSDPLAGLAVDLWGFHVAFLGLAGLLLLSLGPLLLAWRRFSRAGHAASA